MAQLAKVVSVTGNAFVVAADGSRRPIKVGDTIQKDETIITAAGSHVELMMNDGQMMAVAPEHSVRMDETLVQGEGTPSAQDAAVQAATVDQVIQALDRGGDLTEELEAAAAGAGAGGGGEGSNFVRLLRITEGVEPLAYEYSVDGPAVINEPLLSAADAPEPVVGNVELRYVLLDKEGQPLIDEETGGFVYVDGEDVIEGTPVGLVATVDAPPTGTPLVLELSNGTFITIPVGATTGFVPVQIRGDEYFDQGRDAIDVSIVGATGGEYDQLNVDQSTSIGVVDDNDVTNVSVARVGEGDVVEGNDITFRFSVERAPTEALTLNVTIGGVAQQVTIAAGTTYTDVTVGSRDDEYFDQGTSTVTATINSVDAVADGNLENVQIGTASASASVVDDNDVTNVSVARVGEGDVVEGNDITFRFSVERAPTEALTLNVTIGGVAQQVTIAAGTTYTDVTVGSRDDEYFDQGTSTVTATINSVDAVADGNLENVQIGTASASASVVDDNDVSTLTLNVSASTAAEGSQVTYTVTVNHAPETNLVINLAYGGSVTIAAGQFVSTVSSPVTLPNVSSDSPFQNSIAGTSGGNYEALNTSSTVTVTVTDSLPSNPVNDSIRVEEESVPGIGGNNETDGLNYQTTGTFADNATWGGDSFGGIVSVNGVTAVVGGYITVSDAKGTLSVNVTTGAYTYTLDHNVLSTPTANNGENNQAAPSFAIVAQDGDGDQIGFNLNVTVVDDVPTLTSVQAAVVANSSMGYDTGTSVLSIGADHPGTSDLTGNVAGWTSAASFSASTFTSGGATVYYSVSADKGTLFAYTDTNATHTGYTGGAGQTLVFTLTYDSAGNYVIDMNGKLDGTTQTFGASYATSLGGNVDYVLVDNMGSIYKPTDTVPAGRSIVMTVDTSIGTVNASTQGLAADTQWVLGSDTMYFKFTEPLVSASFAIDIQSNASSNVVAWTAYGKDEFGNYTTQSGTTTFVDGVMTKVPTTLTDITRVDLSDNGGDGFRVTSSSLVDRIEETPISTSFQVAVVDADGDKATGTLAVTFQPPPSLTAWSDNVNDGTFGAVDNTVLPINVTVSAYSAGAGTTSAFIGDVLKEGQAVTAAQVASNPPATTIFQQDVSVTVTFLSEGAGYQNAVGWYDVNNPTVGYIIWANASATGSDGSLVGGSSNVTFTVPAGTQLGWFMIPDGTSPNGSMVGLPSTVYFYNGHAYTDAAHTVLINSNDNNSKTDTDPVWFSNQSNADGKQHVIAGVGSEANTLYVGFEDLANVTKNVEITPDNDYNDVVFKASWTGSQVEINKAYFDLGVNINSSSDLSKAVVSLVLGDGDAVSYTSVGGLTVVQSGNTLTITGNASVANYNTLLDSIHIAVGHSGAGEDYSLIDPAVRTATVTVWDTNGVQSSSVTAQFEAQLNIQGDATNNTLTGSAGDDVLAGAAGNDTLNGGLGADVFKWSLGDQGTGASPARDVTDFKVTQGDSLDLRDLLDGEHSASGLANFVKFGTDSGHLTLSIDHNGGGSFKADQTIVLSSYADKSALAADLGLSGSYSDADIINKMISTGNLKTDI